MFPAQRAKSMSWGHEPVLQGNRYMLKDGVISVNVDPVVPQHQRSSYVQKDAHTNMSVDVRMALLNARANVH